MFGRSTSSFDRLLEKATSQLLLEPDWTSIMMICDSIRQGDTNPKYAVTAIKKKFYHSNPHVALYAIQVMESCVKNCGVLVHEEIATKAFMEELRDLVKQSTDENIKTKVLELLQTWGMAFRSSPKYRIVTDTLNLMKAEGWKFPPVREAEAMFEADTAPQWAAGEVCHRCRVAFSTFTRQHHCRACGQVFCGKCSSKSCVLPKFGIEREVRVCDSCFDQYGPKEEEGGSPVHEKGKSEKDGADSLPAEYLASPLSKQPQEPPQPKQGKSEAELKEEEELQLVLALSKSEADEKEAAKKKATSDLLAGYTNGTAAAVKEERREERREIEQQPPELEKYLDRDYWEQQSRSTAKAAMAPTPMVEREQVQVSPPSELHRAENEELDEFTMSLRTQLEIFVNRMKSNSSRGRPIATDSSVQTLFMNVMTMHGKLVKYIAEQEEERVMYEGLQDKLNQVKDARAALDALREEEAERKRLELEEAERQRQIQLAAKLEVMRKKKAEYLEYQRQVALQRMADQEREVAKIAEANKAAYMQQQGMYNMYLPYAGGYQPQPGMQPPGQPLQYPGMPQPYPGYQPGLPPQPGMQAGIPPQPTMQHGIPAPQSSIQSSMAPQSTLGSMPGVMGQPGMAPPQNTMAPMPGLAPQPSMAPHPSMPTQPGPGTQPGLPSQQPGMAPHPGGAPGPGMVPQGGMPPPAAGAPQAGQYPGGYPGYYPPPPPGDSFHMGGMAAALPPGSSQPPAASQPPQYPEGTPQPGAPDQSLISFD